MILEIILVYATIHITYLWIVSFFLLVPNERVYRSNNVPFSIIIPTYNENPRSLRSTLKSVVEAKGDKEIFVVFDGWRVEDSIKKFCKENGVNLLHYEKNRGKRYAQTYAFKFVKNDIVVFVDSDARVESDALLNLVKPFTDPKVGAVTGQICLTNTEESLLAKCIESLYWTSFNIYRKATSQLGLMQVCSGALSAYRKTILDKLSNQYINQKFLGIECAIGDDRFLTMRTQIMGYSVKYVGDAIAHTTTPYKVKNVLKQFIRWQRSMIREGIISLYYFRKVPLLSLDVTLNLIFLTVNMLVRLLMVVIILVAPVTLLYMVAWSVFSSMFYNNYILTRDRRIFFFKIVYGLYYDLVLWIIYPISLITLRKQNNWGTR